MRPCPADARRPVRLIGLSAGHLVATAGVLPLFPEDRKQRTLTEARDRLRDRFGETVLLPAGVLQLFSTMSAPLFPVIPDPPPRPLRSAASPIWIGTSGYSFDDWTGPFYPEGTPKGKRLDYYATQFPCVEINSTYYGIPHPAVMAKLAAKVPDGFEFTAKAFEAMTHRRAQTPELYGQYLEALDPLRAAENSMVSSSSFPAPSGTKGEPRPSRFPAPSPARSRPLGQGYRHDSWDRPEVYRFLRDLRLGFIAVDEPRLPGLFPPVAQVTSDVAYVRFHGRNAVNWYNGTTHGRVDRGSGGGHTNHSDWDYTLAELEEWSGRIREMAARARKAYVFFNNCYMGRAVRSARLMKGLLQPGA